jgi:GT2 family glycosyltransferase
MVLDVESSIAEGYPKPKTEYSPWAEDELYKEHHCISAHFLFTLPSFLEEVLPDPLIMYSGEEMSTAVRAWTRGYRMVTIKNPIAWHLNKFHGDKYEKDRLWDPRNSEEPFKHFLRKNKKGIARAKKILTGDLLGYWGSPTKEALALYEKASGISFEAIYRDLENKDV